MLNTNKLTYVESFKLNLIDLFEMYKGYVSVLEKLLSPKVPDVFERNEYLIGTADPYSTVVLVSANTEYRIQADAQGNWRIENPIINGGSLTIYAVNALGLRSEEMGIAIILPPEIVTAPSTPVIHEQGEYLSGTADPNNMIVIHSNGVQYQIKADAQGNWSIENPILDGGSLMLYAENESGLQSEQIGLAILKPETPQIPEIVQIIENGSILAGSAPSHHKIIVSKNDQTYITYSDESGYWQMDNPIRDGGVASIVVENELGMQSAEIQIVKLAFFENTADTQIADLLFIAEDSAIGNTEEQNSEEVQHLDLVELLAENTSEQLFADQPVTGIEQQHIPMHLPVSLVVLDHGLQQSSWVA